LFYSTLARLSAANHRALELLRDYADRLFQGLVEALRHVLT
jgi:hypothetical protein